MVRKAWRDFFIILSTIWINLFLFILLMILGAVLLRNFGNNSQAGLAATVSGYISSCHDQTGGYRRKTGANPDGIPAADF